MTLPEIHCWRDPLFRPASLQMALDEALFHWAAAAGLAAMRFYHWDEPALTMGYFQRSPPLMAGEKRETPAVVRRFTGGGLVEHGEDITFVLVLPAGSISARGTGAQRYRWIHEALSVSLSTAGFATALEPADRPAAPGPCFSHPVPWDLRDPESGKKIGGGAQRRSRGAVIHQGSIRLPALLRDPAAGWIGDFLTRLSRSTNSLKPTEIAEITKSAAILEKERYARDEWNHRV